jgi:hypothetical protein
MERVGYDDPTQLPALHAALIRRSCVLLLTVLWRQLLCQIDPTMDAKVAGFFQLGRQIRLRLCQLCEANLNIRSFEFDLGLVQHQRGLSLPLTSNVALQADRLLQMITGDLLKQTVASIPEGHLGWESPAGGGRLSTNSGLWLSDFTFAYRLVDRQAGCVFYVVVSGHPCRVVAVYLPAYDQLFVYQNGYREHITRNHAPPIEILLLRHLCEHGEILLASWQANSRAFSLVFRERLISGQMWHDLTGIDLVTRSVAADRIPEIIGMWGLPEIYGKTEELYPETEGKIRRSINDSTALARYAYTNNRCLLRTTSYYVTRRLYTKIIETNLRQPSLAAERVHLERLKASGTPVIMLGLRVENRTVVDLPEFCIRLVQFLTEQVGNVAVVIDGHNSAEGASSSAVFGSEFQHYAKEQPIDVERRVVSVLQDHFSGKPVTLIDNIGAPMSHSVFWCNQSAFFVTFYGTGLAKYRWACNKTGLVVTSQWTLHNQGHLHIYESDFLEDPSPIYFLPEEHVEDLPDAPLLVPEPGNPPARWNFRVKDEGLFASVKELLQRTGRQVG